MEKLKFTIRVFALLLALPVFMFAELTREDSVNKKPGQVIEAKTQNASDNSELVCQFPVLQAVSN